MSELFPPRRTSAFDDPALAFPEFAAKKRMLERVQEEEGEGEDSSYGKGSSRFSSPAISRNGFDDLENPRSKLPSSGLKLSGFQEEEETNSTSSSFVYRIGHEDKRRCFTKCCAWTCMFLFIVLIIVLLAGFSVNFSIKSKLPEVCMCHES